MHYKMRDQIRFKIGKEEKNIQEKWIEIPEGTEHIQMMIEMPEEFRYMAFLFLEDPKKEIRFQKLLGYGPVSYTHLDVYKRQHLCYAKDSAQT